MSVNKVILIGHLGADPDVNFMQNGDPVVNFRMATSMRWNDRNTGEKKEETEWHRITCFGKTGEFASQFLKKGRQVFVEGRLRTRKWTDKDGQERFTTEIVATSVQAVGAKASAEAPDGAPAE